MLQADTWVPMKYLKIIRSLWCTNHQTKHIRRLCVAKKNQNGERDPHLPANLLQSRKNLPDSG